MSPTSAPATSYSLASSRPADGGVVVPKTNSGSEADIQDVSETARSFAPVATVVRAASIVSLDNAGLLQPAIS
jgi:hypothetical protein